MKRNVVILFILFAGVIVAQNSRIIEYEGTLLEENETPIEEGIHAMVFVLFNEANQPIWDEGHENVVVEGGKFHVKLGSITPLSIPLKRSNPMRIIVDGEEEIRPRVLRLDLDWEQAMNQNNLQWREPDKDLALQMPPRAGPFKQYEKYIKRNVSDTSFTSSKNPVLMVVNQGNGNGVTGQAVYGNGLSARSSYNNGIFGRTDVAWGEKAGVFGYSEKGTGVTGRSEEYNGIKAITKSDKHAALACGNEGNGVAIYASGGKGGIAAIFSGNVQVRSQQSGATVLELGEGLDFAEGFHVSNQRESVPGAVLIIDSDNPGNLTISNQPYDKRVAGVVAGAKGLKSGVRLGSAGHDLDVALAGRVYCNVDASFGRVVPGDLLTTSPNPGYAMRVTDYTRAPGAVIGKAMEGLAEGEKGQILILLTLQ